GGHRRSQDERERRMSSVIDWENTPNPVKDNRAGLIGKAVDRYEGPLKITAIDTAAAEASPGVKLVWTYKNAPAQGPRPARYDFFTPSPRPALESDQVHFFGQQVAVVVADTLENAQAGAALVRLTFEDDAKAVIFHDHYDEGVQPP